MKWINVNEKMPQNEPFDHGDELLCYSKGAYLVGIMYNKIDKVICESEETILEDVTHYCYLTKPN